MKQFQIPIFSSQTKGAWVLRFDDVLADALEQGKLQNYEIPFPEKLANRLKAVLPTSSIDAYYGNSTFSGKILPKIPWEIMVREKLGKVRRFKILPEYRL